MPYLPSSPRLLLLIQAFALAACATAPPAEPGDTPEANRPDLTCHLPTNCVSSMGSTSALPLQYTGTPAQAMAALQATLATYPEAYVAGMDGSSLEAIFTTTVGFRDRVDFRVDERAQRIDYRSRSLFGLFDFGKNRARMKDFAARFEKQASR